MDSSDDGYAVLVRTKIGNPRSGFVSLSNFVNGPKSSLPLEGAICITIYGTELLGEEHWDDVDSLWVLIVEMLVEFRIRDKVRIRFPDQPLELGMRRFKGGNVELQLSLDKEILRRETVQEEELIKAIGRAGIAFFEGISRVSPGAYSFAKQYSARIRSACALEDDRLGFFTGAGR